MSILPTIPSFLTKIQCLGSERIVNLLESRVKSNHEKVFLWEKRPYGTGSHLFPGYDDHFFLPGSVHLAGYRICPGFQPGCRGRLSSYQREWISSLPSRDKWITKFVTYFKSVRYILYITELKILLIDFRLWRVWGIFACRNPNYENSQSFGNHFYHDLRCHPNYP